MPVLRRHALNWPAAARRARIAFWCRPDTVAPLKAVPLQPSGSLGSAREMFESLPGVSYQWRLRPGTPDRVDVVIFYPTENPDVGALQAELAGPRRVERTLHRFDPAHRVSTHTFLLEAADADAVSRFADCMLEFTSRNAVQAGARSLAEPVMIDLFDSGDVIPLPPARRP